MKRTKPKMPAVYWYFKLFNSIKEKHEIAFAQLELIALFGNVEPVRNYADILEETPFHNFRCGVKRVQDFFAHELPYGECQGFLGKTNEVREVSQLVKRLAYTREFFVATESGNPSEILEQMFSKGVVGKNVEYFQSNGFVLLRFITNQYFLEKSQYISKLSRNEDEATSNVESLLLFLTENLFRIPATETMQIGKRLEDYFAVREEPSLYLTHYMHPYKGKFHPKMVRALLNYAFPKPTGTVMDNFAGCGTLLVEATWMGLNSIGVEINPLSALMCNVKCNSLNIPLDELKKGIANFIQTLRSSILSYESESSGSSLLVRPEYDKEAVDKARKTIPSKIAAMFSEQNTISHVVIAHQLIEKVNDIKIREFLLLGLSGSISDLTRRRRGGLLDVIEGRLRNLYLRIYIFNKLNKAMKIELGKSVTYTADTRDMKIVQGESIDAIVNSPPYSTALDYIKNDFPQLKLLELVDVSELETKMIGNPQFRVYSQSLLKEIESNSSEYANLPQNAKEAVSTLTKYGRTKEAMRTYKFFKDMYLALKEMHRVLKTPSKCIIVIGNNHYKLDESYVVIKNDEVLKEMALMLGFKEDRTIVRELEKSQAGMIRYESILILEKPLA